MTNRNRGVRRVVVDNAPLSRCGPRGLLCLFALALVVHASGCAGGAETQAVLPAKPYAFVHGQWFDGEGFQSDTWYAVQGRLTRQAPSGPVETWIFLASI